MRKSVIRHDPGFDPLAWKYQAFFDGEELENCFTADEEEGKAWVYAINDKIYPPEQEIKCLEGKVKLQ